MSPGQECLCDTYGAPVGYNAPTNSYEPVVDDYGAPLAPVQTGYGAPVAEYGAPVEVCDCLGICNRRTFHLGKKKEKKKDKECQCDCGGYAAPVTGYGAPSYDYQAPSVGYGAPVDSYGAPVDSYGAPIESYAAPYDTYGAPVAGYGAPSSVCACDRTFGNHGNKDKDKVSTSWRGNILQASDNSS